MEEIKSCPFCGGGAIMLWEKPENSEISDCVIICRDCKVSTRKYIDEELCIKHWNRRISNLGVEREKIY